MTTRAVRARNIFAMRPVAYAVKGRLIWAGDGVVQQMDFCLTPMAQ